MRNPISMSQGDHPDAARALLDAADSAAMLASEAGALDTVGIEAQCRSEAALMVRQFQYHLTGSFMSV